MEREEEKRTSYTTIIVSFQHKHDVSSRSQKVVVKKNLCVTFFLSSPLKEARNVPWIASSISNRVFLIFEEKSPKEMQKLQLNFFWPKIMLMHFLKLYFFTGKKMKFVFFSHKNILARLQTKYPVWLWRRIKNPVCQIQTFDLNNN